VINDTAVADSARKAVTNMVVTWNNVGEKQEKGEVSWGRRKGGKKES
jgi:hypothetical protein